MIEWTTVILVVVTGIYCYFTYKILKANELVVMEMRGQNELFIRPYIIVNTFVTKGAQYYLRIKNTGKSAAFNLEMTLDKNFFMCGIANEGRNIKAAYIFNNTINVFPPDSEVFFLLGHGSVFLGDKNDEKITPQEFTITTNYSFHSNTYSEKTIINLKQFENSIIYSDSIDIYLKEISEHIKELTNKIGLKNKS